MTATLAPAQETGNADVAGLIRTYFETYHHSMSKIDKIKLQNFTVDADSQSVKVIVGGSFADQIFTPEVVDSVYKDIRQLLPDSLRRYNLSIVTEDHRIEDLVPNFFRKNKKEHDQSRLLQKEYTGSPWVTNVSRPYRADKGLEGKHIALWQSHGRYFKNSEKNWAWQRPNMYCTNEDVFSQSFVVPYIIPMLQNAGAIVFTPRERDWQKNEVIVDNDGQSSTGMYMESYSKHNKPKQHWTTAKAYGFAQYKQIYETCDTPFVDGTSRYISTVTSSDGNAFAQWVPELPENGRYAVYVTYHSYANSTTDAHYTVYHKGGKTEFKVNQKIGGGTWVYLGTFDFDAGFNSHAMVTLSNASQTKSIVSADAVRFGGGMGNVVPQSEECSTPQSGMPRWVEAAKYSTFWYGMPYSVHTGGFGADEYKNDINSRSKAINYLCGGSMFNPNNEGLRVPLEATIAFHTDAGYYTNDSVYGSLAIYRTAFNNGLTGAGLDRYVSRDLASILLTNLLTDLKKYKWEIRQLWNRNYGEAREPLTPTCILEMLSHQNFTDVKLAYDPHFKFDFCRSVYKSIVKFIATEHKKSYVIQPLPVHAFSISLNETKGTAELHWAETKDPSEPTATAQQYIVYTRIGNEGFDNGTLVKECKHSVKLIPNTTYSFRVTAVNQGGESFPSETLSAGIASENKGTILVVNGFTRLEAPYSTDNDSVCGFDLDKDPGVQYGAFTGFVGRQQCFDKTRAGIESKTGLGYSGEELAGKIIMGNTFDYPYIHGQAIMTTRSHSFTSTSEEAFSKGTYDLQHFKAIDVIYGVQKKFSDKTLKLLDKFGKNNGNLLVSGANIAKAVSGISTLSASVTGQLCDKSVTEVHGNKTSFNFYREMNETCYSVPEASQLKAQKNAFPMLLYADGTTAAVASKGASGNQNGINAGKSVVLGFPLETITSQANINRLMRGIIKFFE